MYIQEQEERDFYIPSEAELDRHAAYELGSARPGCAWVLTDRDVWYPNPFYSGPPQRHPEDDGDCYGDGQPVEGDDVTQVEADEAASPFKIAYDVDTDIPF